MITSSAFQGKTYAVLGLARSGLASVRSLVASGAQILAWDAREEAREAAASCGPGVEIVDPMAADLEGCSGIVVSPGVPLNRHPIAQVAKTANVPVIGDVELFAQARPTLPSHRVVGITGTNGKSTTTALIHHLLEQAGIPSAMAGNIGIPILELDPLGPGGVYALELSSYQIDLTDSLACEAAVLTNIRPDHLDRYSGFEAYRSSKLRLFEMQEAGALAVIADPDIAASGFGADGPRVLRVSPADVEGRQSAWPALMGPHNAENAACAIAVARFLGLEEDRIEAGLRSFRALPHRMELVAEVSGVRFINDSKATNPDSTAPALAAFPNIHWIVGGLPKSDELGPCERELKHVRAAYTIGEAGPMFARLLEGRVPVKQCELLIEAVRCASRAAEPGDVVLLSPACASFDQFSNYESRGEAFRAAVEALA